MQPLPSSEPGDDHLVVRVPYINETKIETNPKKIGNCYAYWYTVNGDPRILIGPDYKFYIALNVFILCFSLVVLIAAAIKGRTLAIILEGVMLMIQSTVYALAAFKNPGLPSWAVSRMRYQILQGSEVPR